MEATGVYWKPVWNILSDGDFELIVANAAHIKNVPGRKTDVNDATWIADLVACGLIRASFVPEEAIQELRSLLRARKQLIREQTSHIQRIQKTLEEANIKLDTVISDIMGVSGRRMIEAMIAGVRNPQKLAALADRRIKASPKVLYDALHGRLTEHHRFMLELYLGQYDALSKAIVKIDHAGRCGDRADGRGGGGRSGHLSIPDLKGRRAGNKSRAEALPNIGGQAATRSGRTFGRPSRADAPVLDQLMSNLVRRWQPPASAKSRRSAERIWRLCRHGRFRRGEQRLGFFAGALSGVGPAIRLLALHT